MTLKDAKELLAGQARNPLVEAAAVLAASVEADSVTANNLPDLPGRMRHFNAGRIASLADFRHILAQVSSSNPSQPVPPPSPAVTPAK